MATEKFPKAPIMEALIDIQIDPVLGNSAKSIELVHSEIAAAYPTKKPRRLWETKLEFKEGNPVQAESENKGIQGYQFWSADEKQVVQFRLDGFSFSRLKPYEAWEKSYPETVKLWNIYLKRFNPKNIKRLAVRYINVIEIPSAQVELSDYFVQPPQPPEGLPQSLEGFLSRLVIRYDEVTRATVTITPQPQGKPNTMPIVFDIDVFSSVNLPASYEKLDQEFARLHEIVWTVFKKSLKPKTEELFK